MRLCNLINELLNVIKTLLILDKMLRYLMNYFNLRTSVINSL